MGEINVRFREMNDGEYKRFVEDSVLDYSKDLIKSRRCSEEEAFEEAQKSINELLPKGKDTENNFFYTIVNSENEDVGMIWYGQYKEKTAFISDFLIFEKFRKKGYGRQALLLLDKDAEGKGFKKILLHVFRFNTTAFNLYSSLGYQMVQEEPSGIVMVKDV